MLRVLEINVDDHLNGGVYVLVRDIVKRLPDHIKADIAALEEFDDPNHIEQFKKYDCNVYYVGYRKNKLLKQIKIYKNVKKLIKDNGYDVVHIHSDVSHKLLVSGLAAKKAGVKRIILHSHANDVEGTHKGLRRAFHKFGTVILRSIPAVYLATSEDAGKWMFPWLKSDQFTVLDNGVDYDRFKYNGDKRLSIRRELGVDDKYVLGMVGRFVYQKNVFYVPKILKELIKDHSDVRLVCVGDGPLKEEFTNQVKDLGLDDYITMVGIQDNIEDYYQAFDVFIMPSAFEGFGLTAVEAQISRTPVIASVNVPEATRISDHITYLPIEENSIGDWCSGIMNYMSWNKNDSVDIDTKYDIKRFVDSVIGLYEWRQNED